MKKIILGAILLFSTTLFSQKITLNEPSHFIDNGNLVSHVNNGCGGVTDNDITITNLNLGNNILYLKQGTTLTITGVLTTGGINGKISKCSNGSDNACVIIGGNPEICTNSDGDITNGTLSSPTFDFARDYGYSYKAYDITGKVLSEGVTGFDTFHRLPKRQILILKVDNFTPIKIVLE
jgi:hypothetical protein